MKARPRTKASNKRIVRVKDARRIKKKKGNPTIGYK